jgi:hypothetical protein
VYAELSFLRMLAGRELEVVLVSSRRRGRVQGLLGAWGCRCVHERECGPALERLRAGAPDAVLAALPAPELESLARSIAALDRPRRGPWPRLLALAVTDRPNGATDDRHNGAIWRWSFGSRTTVLPTSPPAGWQEGSSRVWCCRPPLPALGQAPHLRES